MRAAADDTMLLAMLIRARSDASDAAITAMRANDAAMRCAHTLMPRRVAAMRRHAP